jgi:uncharacterized protein YllA (UPF0747 family)
MHIERVPLSALPDHFRPVAAAFAEGDARLASRFPVSWRDEKALAAHARAAAARGIDPDLKLEGPAFERLKKCAPAVVTGQQPSVALGPMYNVYKAITAIRWARKLGAVPVFWNHSDDDNLEGLNRLAFPERLVEAAWEGEGALAFRGARLDLDALPVSPEAREILRGNLRGELAGDFTRLLHALFGDELLVVEPRQLDGPRAREIFRKALADPGLVQRAVDRGGERLKDLGFERALGHSLGSNVYEFTGPRREKAESGAAGRLSAGVALRLIVQDAVLPAALVVAGPNEIAYVAQLRELYEAFGRTGPVVAPRITATIMDPRSARVAHAMNLKGAEVLTGRALDPSDARTVGEIDSITADLERRFDALEADPTARDATRKTRERMRTILSAYRERVVAAAKQADGVSADRARKLAEQVLPEGKLQERVLPAWYFLSLAGPDFVRRLTDELDPFCPDHQLVWL